MTRFQLLLLTILLGLLGTMLSVAIDTTAPAMPATAAGLGVGVGAIQFAMSLLILGVGLGQVIYGPLSDRFGRKPVLLCGVALYVLAGAGAALASSITIFVAFRMLEGLAACSGQVVGRTIARDHFEREDSARFLAYMMAVVGLAPVAVPIIGGYLSENFDFRAVYWFIALYGAVLFVAIVAGLKESLAPERRQPIDLRRIAANYGVLLRDRLFLGYCLLIAATYAALFAYLSTSGPLSIRELGESPQSYSYFFASIMFCHFIGAMTAGRIVGRWGIDRLIRIGVTVNFSAGFVIAACAWTGQLDSVTLSVFMGVILAAFPFVVSQSIAAALGPFTQFTGTASSLLGFLQLLVAAATIAAIGWIDGGTARSMGSAIGIATLVAALGYYLHVRNLAVPALPPTMAETPST